MIPIPKEILIHSCILKIFRVSGIYGNCVLQEEINLSNVRLSLCRKTSSDVNGRVVKKTGVLYYDCTLSSPQNTEFLREGCRSIVEFEGNGYEVTRVEYVYSDSGLHHLEIGLGE